MRRKRLGVRLRHRLAPLNRAVAIGAHFTPVDGQHRAFSPLHLRQRSLAQDGDELLTDRNMQAALSAAEMPSTELPSLRANEMAHVSACRQ
jgi:hypothetical protein